MFKELSSKDELNPSKKIKPFVKQVDGVPIVSNLIWSH
mgnify:CR=1 FL=1|jgi:hypothetical protein